MLTSVWIEVDLSCISSEWVLWAPILGFPNRLSDHKWVGWLAQRRFLTIQFNFGTKCATDTDKRRTTSERATPLPPSPAWWRRWPRTGLAPSVRREEGVRSCDCPYFSSTPARPACLVSELASHPLCQAWLATTKVVYHHMVAPQIDEKKLRSRHHS